MLCTPRLRPTKFVKRRLPKLLSRQQNPKMGWANKARLEEGSWFHTLTRMAWQKLLLTLCRPWRVVKQTKSTQTNSAQFQACWSFEAVAQGSSSKLPRLWTTVQTYISPGRQMIYSPNGCLEIISPALRKNHDLFFCLTRRMCTQGGQWIEWFKRGLLLQICDEGWNRLVYRRWYKQRFELFFST